MKSSTFFNHSALPKPSFLTDEIAQLEAAVGALDLSLKNSGLSSDDRVALMAKKMDVLGKLFAVRLGNVETRATDAEAKAAELGKEIGQKTKKLREALIAAVDGIEGKSGQAVAVREAFAKAAPQG